jgi:hypothetical protein
MRSGAAALDFMARLMTRGKRIGKRLGTIPSAYPIEKTYMLRSQILSTF